MHSLQHDWLRTQTSDSNAPKLLSSLARAPGLKVQTRPGEGGRQFFPKCTTPSNGTWGLYREGKIVDPPPYPGLDFRPWSPRARRVTKRERIASGVGAK